MNLFRLIVNRCRKDFSPDDTVDWVSVLEDFLKLQKSIFGVVSSNKAISIFVDQILSFSGSDEKFLELVTVFICQNQVIFFTIKVY